ncbi:hypothetical protein O3G_MSEX015366 [Manduca sexta]|uniref:Uncharacterized protein n=1 Tax=Manduca sexta TaxID=7130 RepID=A0A922D5H8_MANSE|nr:hypothetical protein O3G_MSEX015366 [Manduca sexta]
MWAGWGRLSGWSRAPTASSRCPTNTAWTERCICTQIRTTTMSCRCPCISTR